MRHALVVQIDLNLSRQTDPQRVPGEFFGVDMNAHRYPLDDLDPVAGGVLCRQQGKGTAGARTEANQRLRDIRADSSAADGSGKLRPLVSGAKSSDQRLSAGTLSTLTPKICVSVSPNLAISA